MRDGLVNYTEQLMDQIKNIGLNQLLTKPGNIELSGSVHVKGKK